MGSLPNIATKIALALVILVAILVVSFALILGYFTLTAPETSQAVHIYDLELFTTGPLENATLLVPLPSYYDAATGKNETVVDLSRTSFENFDQDTISVEIEEVNGVPMLKIAADRIAPLYTNRIEPILAMPGENESDLPQPTHIYSDQYSEETPVPVAMELSMYDTAVDHEIDTRTPLGKEPLFMPYRITENISGSEGGMDGDYYLSEGASGHLIEVPFILSYDADDENVLTISTEFQGTNQWWVLGWQSNSYRERIRHEFEGACNGTYQVRGVLITGEGVY
ncbi:hypothetical protein E2N92_12605 [Methanofollis formosanus]|uniref:Uncharacterized protein n=1 Tax=Methanofollis formosanus TaxID=299308 RepID=A0A8G1A381_9EURY|nr:hypothetical protein [Methanofollis formosanus]QYZ80211.1 hypothetical protein E2N92_12605 [Methanofollis formosanus]